jgi:hypothetical protein
MLSRRLLILIPVLLVSASLIGFSRLLPSSLAHPGYIKYPRTFQIECLDCPGSFSPNGDRYLKLDPSQTPHMVYAGEGRVWLAWKVLDTWHKEVVAETRLPIDKFASSWTAALAISTNGDAKVAYTGDDGLYLACQSSSGWYTLLITDNLGADASVTSIALDENDYAHIPFYDSNQRKLRYAHQSASGWDFQEIDRGEYVGLVTSFFLDAQDYGHLSYSASKAGGGLRYADQGAAGWQIQQVDPVLSDINTSLAFDAAGDPHISYYASDFHELRHATPALSGWVTETVATALELGGESSLAFAPGDIPCIAYPDQFPDRLKLACKAGSGWTTQELVSGLSGHPSLLFSTSGSFQIAHFNRDSGQLLWTAQGVPGLVTELVDTSIRLDGPLAIQLDVNDGIHLVYHQLEPAFQVRYAYQDAGGWHKQALVDLASLCEAMALDSQGYPHLTCLAPLTHTLEYAYQDITGWYTQTLTSLGASRGYSSIVIGDQDWPHISYYDGIHQSLVYAHLTSTGWITETALSHACFYSSLALDADDLPVIGCIRPEGGTLEVVSQGSGGWSIEYPDPALADGKYVSLVLNAAGEPRLSYMNTQAPCSLNYASRSGGVWTTEILDQGTGGCSGLFPSLKLDSFGNPHIAYYDEASGALKYIFKDAFGWHKQVVDQSGSQGYYSSLALDHRDRAWIAYMDMARHDLILAHTSFELYLPIVQ